MSYKYISPFEEEKKGGFFGIGDKTEKPTEPEYNYISPFEEEQKEGSSILRRAVGDPLVALARGTLVGIPETVTGLLDIPTLGYAGKAAEAVGRGLGIGGFKEGREFFDKMLTPETQEAQRKVSEAEGFVDTVKTAVQNPSAIAQVVAESIPSMVAGAGAVGKGAKALGYGLRKLSPEITAAARGAIEAGKDATVAETRALNMVEKVQKANLMKAATIGGISEGAVTAGQNLEQVRQDEANPEGTLTPGQIGLNVAAGAVTGVIGVLSGKLAARLGLVDPQTFAAMLTTGGIPKTVAEKAKWTKLVADGLKTMAREGFLEELPQSMQEQIAQNLSLGKPIDDQVFQQGALGLLAGMAQAGGAHVLSTSIDRMRSPVHQDIERQLDDLGPEVTDVVKGTPEPVVVAQPAAAPQAVVTEPAATVEPVQAAPVAPAAPAAPVIIPEAIRTEVAAMSDRNLTITAEKDREAIVRQAAAEEIQKRAAAPAAAPAAAAPVEKPAAAPSDIVMKTLEGKTQTQLDTLANEQPDTPIGIAARALWNKNATNAERILKEKEQAATPAAAEKIDYEAQAAAKGISLDNFKKVQNIGELNKWAKEGVEGAQIELARRAQEGLIQPEQITWNIPEAPEAAEAPIPPAAGEPTVQATKGKIPKAAPFAQEVKVKGETQTRIDKVVDYHKNVLGQNLSGEQKLKAEKAIGMQTAAIGRKIEGRPTATEKKVARKKLESLHAGRQVTVNGSPAEVTGVTSYGKHEVKLQDGTMVFAEKSEIQSVPVTNQDVLDHLKSEGLKELEQAESIITPAKKEGEAKYGTAEESGRPTAGGPSTGEKRDSVLSEVQKRHGRRVGTLRQVILADASSPADIRKAAGTEGGIVFYPEGYNDPEFQKASDVAGKYGMEAIPIFSESGSVNGMVHRGYVYINMAGGADTTTMETVYHEISHAKGNAETQDKVDTESDAFIQFRTTYSKVRTGKKDTLLPIALVLDEYAAELDSGVKVRFGVNLVDGLKPGTSVLPLSEAGGKIKASGDISYSIARDKGARILEEGSKKKFKTIFQIANFLSRRVPIDYQAATSAENREVERKLADFLNVSMAKLPEAKGWYKKDFVKTMKILETLDPAIKNPENNFRMRLAIAITSNGNKSIPTIETAWDIYRNWADNGNFMLRMENIKSKNIKNSAVKVNKLRSHFKSDLEMEKWLMGTDTLRNIEEEVGGLLKLSGGEKKDEIIPRASTILGPKLGAFFNNLSGNFDPVTMDRWFMRTIGRITGTLAKISEADTKRERLRKAITDEVISEVWGNELGIVRASELTEDDLDSLALAIDRGKWRNLKDKYEEAKNAGNALADSLKGKLQDSPSSGGQREWIRERMEKVRKAYPQFDLSDIQAAIWIGEKELFHELGGRKEKADYYSEGAEALARKHGKGELLRRIAGPAGRIRPEDTGRREQPALFSLREPSKEQRLKSGLSYQVMDMIRANPDGFTIDITTGGMVEKGYAVAPTKRTETPLDELTDENVDAFLLRNQDLFEADDRAFFGGWLDQDEKSENFGKYVLDVSYVVDSYEDAVYIAEIGAQDGIYHIEAGRYIPTRDGLKDLKTRGLFKAGKRAELRGIQEGMHRIIESRRPDQGKIDYSVRGTARRTGTGRSQQVRGRVTGTDPEIRVEAGIHYSRQQRTVLDSKFYGTGLADAARLRLPSNQKSPLWQRIYFYYDSPEYGIHPEPGVGTFRHSADFSGLKVYNPYSRQILVSQVMGEHVSNTFEKAILKAGYDGYANPDKGMIVLLGKRKVEVQPADVRYSVREAAMALPEQIQSLISAGLSGFAEHPENLPKAEVAKVVDELKTHKDFSKLEYALSVPARMAQKHPQTWGKLYRIFAVDREETRDELRQEFQKKAEPFLMYDRRLHDKKVPKAEIAASMARIERAVITGDALAVEFTDEQLTEGINDKYGKEIKLNKDEIAAYRAVRDTLRHIRSTLVNHLANQTLRGYRRNKWFKILEAAVKGDGLNVETLQTLLDKKGMKQAALDRAKKLQPNITKIFKRIEAGVDKIPPQELAKAGKAYEKIANSLQAELTELQGYVSELTGETDKTKLTEMTREIFSAYMQTRPQMKVIRALRNEVGALDGYFPRFRESGDKKFRVYEQEVDENGNIVIDEKTGKEARREVFMKMFSNARQGNEVIKEAMRTLKIKQSDLTPDGKFPAKYFVEIARQTASPESAYQGVNDINLQRLFDDAMRAAQEKGVHGLETTYIDANGREVDVFEQIRQAGLQSLTNHLKARGAMQRSIKRSEDLIEGYQETDLQRVLLDYITSMSGLMTKQVAASEAMEVLSTIKDPFLFSSMSRYTREMLRNNSLADRISGYTRSAAFTYFLGGLLKSAVVNLTQNPIVGFAELAKFMREHNVGGAGKSDLLYAKAMKDVLTGNLSEAEKAFIDKMVSRGIASNQFIQSVFENVMNKGLRRHIAVMNFLAKPFSMSEVFNRKSAAIAMYRVAYGVRLAEAKANGLTGTEAEAEAERVTFDDGRDFITNVHYAYGSTNRPLPIMTGDALGAAAASMYTFKGFSHNFLARQAELLSKGDFRTLGHTLAYLTLFGGLATFPFLRDLFDWWEKEYGYNPMNNVRAMLRGIGGETLEKFGVSGLPSVLGANFSGSLAVGLPWPIGASSPEDSIFGVWSGVATKAKRSVQAFAHGDINRGITEISPEFMRAPRVALRESEIGKKLLGTPGYATNIRGHAILGEDGKPISMSAWEAALKAMGFNPTDYARAKEKTQNIVRQTAWVNDLKQNVAERYRAARLNNDKDATKDMIAGVREVNAKIRSRNLQRLVTPLKVSNVIKSAKPKIGIRQRREMLYKREEL